MDQFIQRVIKVLKDAGSFLWQAAVSVWDQEKQDAVIAIDAMATKYLPMSTQVVTDVEAMFVSGAIIDSERRSVAFTKISEELQTLGHDVMADGYDAFVNLLIELGVNTKKALQGKSLGSSPHALAALNNSQAVA